MTFTPCLHALFLGCVLLWGICAPVAAGDLNLTDDKPFDCDDCVNGECGAWTNGCVCWRDQLNLSGKNCDEEPSGACKTNKDCKLGAYCNIDKNAKSCAPDLDKGFCFNATRYSTVQVSHKQFILSRPLMNWYSAQNFCSSLGTGWQVASRTDLECDGIGIGCTKPDYIKAFQEKTGIRGFLWLKETAPDCKALYIDLNDGAIYNTRMNSVATAQALCIKK